MLNPVSAAAAAPTGMLALSSLIPSFDGSGSVKEFVTIVEQLAVIGAWPNEHTVCLCKCKMTGAAREFVWNDAKAKEATTFSELKEVLLRRFDTEPLTVRTQRFMSARQAPSEDIRSFATRIQMLAQATVSDEADNTAERKKIRQELLREQMKSQFVQGLRDPVRRFVMSRNPQTFDAAVDCAAQEESNESLCSSLSGIRLVDEHQRQSGSDVDELKRRLENIETLLSRREQPRQQRGQRTFWGQGSRECYVCGNTGHLARACNERAPSTKQTYPKNW